ncbi:AAC(6')-Ighjkrstuvwx family aminoglycoside N-acetyltransferase [Acinetobacter beijerinckii]|uniref:AAC(6')-Ighjkrstuvwx family aminoglycoside N-acetyltransferase n=1 Tax=Acinetobacter beijerinckii TaxID=262668 RepID=UPI0023DD7927|nr:AAC(6')-Ighjkrstuvwx family aminoglycoside N-acetyltransferase [Acinetobacter beijerinckii]MDF2417388.1 AAC(6')-Ighjkrstuvwx family aminoglycoside N-acetyltransferase [Acinetobacter beijerinckii]
MKILSVSEPLLADWLRLRILLWPNTEDAHLIEMRQLLAEKQTLQLMAYSNNQAVAILEASIRHEYVNGTETSPVAYLEGIYVCSEFRRLGVATNLIRQAEDWATQFACTEFASDTAVDNLVGQVMHKALGFQETERVIYFSKKIK